MYATCPRCLTTFPHKTAIEYNENTILVEGGDDGALIFGLIKARNISLDVSKLAVSDEGGYTNIVTALKNIERRSGYNLLKKLVIIADADSATPNSRFKELTALLKPQEFSIPEKIGDLSLSQQNKKQAGIYLFPDNINKGIIEDLCLSALSYPDKLSCIDDHITCIKNKKLLATPRNEISKTKLHIYMATSSKPTGSVGGAIQSKDLDIKSIVFNNLVALLQQL